MHNGKVLLIDDDLQFSGVMQELLQMENYQITCLDNTDAIVTAIKKSLPDVILMDYCLKEANDGEIIKKLRKEKQTADLPIILLSAYPAAHLPLNDIPFNIFMRKPFDLWEFLDCLKELLPSAHLQNGYLSPDGGV